MRERRLRHPQWHGNRLVTDSSRLVSLEISSWYALSIAKKKADEPERKSVQTNLRIIDPMMLVLNILIEEALRARGLWGK